MVELISIPSAEVDYQKNVCAICKEHSVTRWCDYVIRYDHAHFYLRNYKNFVEANRRGAQYKTCDLPMCEECAHQVSLDHDFCPYHKRLQEQVALPDVYQKKRQELEKQKIMRMELGYDEPPTAKEASQLSLFD